MLIFRTLFFTFILLIFSSPVPAWQHVKVQVPLDPDKSLQELQQQGLREGYSQAVVQESQRIVPGDLSTERKQVLRGHLDWRMGDLVLGYRIFSREEMDDQLVMELDVNVDTTTLRNLLQRIGVYYTSTVFWRYDLNTRGAGPDDFATLQRLQKITGVEVDGQAPTSVSLRRIQDRGWSGTIEHEDLSHTVADGDLYRVWFDLWAYFFTRPEIMAEMTVDFVLKTTGWATTDAIMHFDDMLMSWDQMVEEGSILQINTDVPSFRAVWTLTTLTPDLLQERLDGYLPSRGIYHTMDETRKY
ncbi:hypothetical protein [Desulfonatronospira sp.]|uniref:hypothetical protein n=1 Tax=Desulfonatronospira sp. TaxID=1962951 RepID=UPI0025C4FDF1|nr:hypothetical protein [Desulfonatronospira sp.]